MATPFAIQVSSDDRTLVVTAAGSDKLFTVDASSGNVLVYEPGDEGDKGQVIEQKINNAQLPQAMAFLMGTGRLEEDFTFRLLDANNRRHAWGTFAYCEARLGQLRRERDLPV